MAREIHVADAKSGALQKRIESSQDLVRHMLEDEELFHGQWFETIITRCAEKLKCLGRERIKPLVADGCE